jgi:hypothetical protein
MGLTKKLEGIVTVVFLLFGIDFDNRVTLVINIDFRNSCPDRVNSSADIQERLSDPSGTETDGSLNQ